MSDTENNIIEFYKKVNESKEKGSLPNDDVKEISNEVIIENVPKEKHLIVETDTLSGEKIDPFEKFVGVFTNIVEEAKKKEPERIIENTIKKQTIDFINKLKKANNNTKSLPEKIQKKVKAPQKILAEEETSNVVESDKEETEPAEIDKKTENNYVKELRTLDKEKKKNKTIKSTDLKSLISQQVEKQVKEAVQQIQNKIIKGGIGESGGGSNAVQYANGGTMNGDLNVTGKYLSGGKDLITIFSNISGNGGSPDRLISGSESFILNPDGSFVLPNDTLKTTQDTNLKLESENTSLSAYTQLILSPYAFAAFDGNSNIISFDSVDNSIVLTTNGLNEWTFNDKGDLRGPASILTIDGSLDVSKYILSGGKNLDEIFITGETDSQTLTFSESSLELSISNGNTVNLSSINSFFGSLSANWQESYTNLTTNSAAYLSSVDLSFLSVSSTWNESYTIVSKTSGNWNTAFSVATALSAVNSVSIQTVLDYLSTSNISISSATVYGDLDVRGQILSGGININQILSSTGGGMGDPAVNTLVHTYSAEWFEPVRKFDYTTVLGVDYSYSGTAIYGTPEDYPAWNIIKLTYGDNGTVLMQSSAYNSWSGRLTASYV